MIEIFISKLFIVGFIIIFSLLDDDNIYCSKCDVVMIITDKGYLCEKCKNIVKR